MKKFCEYRENYSYETALRYQAMLNQEGFFGLFGFTPPPTITLGIGSDGTRDILLPRELLAEKGIEIVATDRGGKATYHGPGQLVGFPLVNLTDTYGDARAVRRFSQDLLMGLAQACAGLGVRSVETRADFPGVWTRRGKLASIGIAVKAGFIFHGFALNVNRDSHNGFSLIEPCGIAKCQITSLEHEGVRVESFEALQRELTRYMETIFPARRLSISPSEKFDRQFEAVVSKVSRSPAALDYLASSLRSNSVK